MFVQGAFSGVIERLDWNESARGFGVAATALAPKDWILLLRFIRSIRLLRIIRLYDISDVSEWCVSFALKKGFDHFSLHLRVLFYLIISSVFFVTFLGVSVAAVGRARVPAHRAEHCVDAAADRRPDVHLRAVRTSRLQRRPRR